MSDFVHLHLHSEYSLLDGATRISAIADKAIAEGQKAVAITDHGVMYGAVLFYNELKKKGIKPIIGCEVYVAPRSRFLKEGKADSSGNHLILLCKNEIGYKNLCYMVSESFINGFYQKPRVDMELLKSHHEGLIALSACLAGIVPSYILAGSMEEAERHALEFRDVFGEDFYLEVQNHHMDEERRVAFGLKTISEKTGIPLVATNDVHYLEKEDAETQAVLTCIQTGNVLSEGRPFGFSTDEYYFRSTKEMEALFSGFPGAIENTVKIAEKCNFDFTFGEYHFPTFTPKNGKTHQQTLAEDTKVGFEKRIADGLITFTGHSREEYEKRMAYELDVINRMGFDAYFLIVSDFVGYAKRNGIPVGPGRGSGAGSLVAFCIGITDVDPVVFDLLFERFLNPERVSMPDFDIDFSDTRREEVIDYVKRKYGEDKVAQIVTFGTLAARAVIRDVGRALELPYSAVDAVAKLVPRELNVTIDDALKNKEFREVYDADPAVKKLIDVSRKLEGMPRHASMHAAGVVITGNPTYTYVPLAVSGTSPVTQFDMNTIAKLGLIKFDFLGIRYLTVIDDAEKMIRKKQSDFDITKVGFDDKNTYSLISHAKTDGIFQLESGGMKQVLLKLAPSTLEDITACVALFRPGPMSSIDTFIDRKHGKIPVTYDIPSLAPILDVTYGCMVYQEQVMQICQMVAGYSLAKADIVRRAMAKKNEEAMLAEEDAFLQGAKARGVDETAAKKLFSDMLSFASYAFNKSHATAYAVLAYRTAYLKANYPAEYIASLLSSVMSDTTAIRQYSADAVKTGVLVLRPDINESNVNFSVTDDGNIRYGLLAIKGVGRPFAHAVVEERRNGRFVSFDEFIGRLSATSELNKRTVEALIKSGVFDSLGQHRSVLLTCYDDILTSEQEKRRNNVKGQIDFFSLGGNFDTQSTAYPYPRLEEYTKKELLMLEKESSGMYFSGHLTDEYSTHISSLKTDKTVDILVDYQDETTGPTRYKDKTEVTLAGIVTVVRKKTVKNGDTMAFITVDDKFGELEIIVFAKSYAKYSELLYEESPVIVRGLISEEEANTPRIVLLDCKQLLSNSEYGKKTENKAEKQIEKRVTLYLKVSSLTDKNLVILDRLSLLHPGEVSVVLYSEADKKYVKKVGCEIEASDTCLSTLKKKFGEDSVVLK